MSSAPTRVFISYSHDSHEHKDKVWALAERLRNTGIDCRIDQHEESPDKGWPQWCVDQVRESDFVLMLCTEPYASRFEGNEQEGQGKGVVFEGYVITQAIYESQGKNKKFVPVVFLPRDFEHIPLLLRGPSRYDLSNPEQYEALYWRLTKQTRKPGPIGVVIQRVFGQSSQDSPGKEPLPKLERKQTFSLPPSSVAPVPSPYFTGLEAILESVQSKLGQSNRVALSGMRGVGKTQIAKRYAHSHRKDYSRIFWARAEKHGTFVADFGLIAQVLDLPQKDEKDQSIIVAAVKNWLEVNPGWLLILDNADDISLAQQFVPATHEGRVLLTSTASFFVGWVEKVPVEQMDPDEAALLLLRRAAVIGKEAQLKEAREGDRKLAEALAEELGGLPLALDQAGAFIEETPSTLSEYKQFYENEGKRLRELRGGLSSDHPSVTVTFSLAFQELAKRDPVAADLVRLCAFLAPDAIPEEIFTKGASALGPEFARRVESPVNLANTIKQAATFSLIRRDAPDHSIDIHRLVQEVLKDEMNAEQLRHWAERAVLVMCEAFPKPEFRNWPDCERMLPHAKASIALIEKICLESKGVVSLLHEVGSYIGDRGGYDEAEVLHRRASMMAENVYGPEHEDLATCLDSLAIVYFKQGQHAKAEPLFQRALAIREKALGPEKLEVAFSLNNLAEVHEKQYRYDEAEPLHQRSLAIREKVLGPDHHQVALCLSNLGLLYRNQGRYAEAESLYERSLAIREKSLGPEHPDVAISLNNLGSLYDDQGQYAKAEPLHKRALTILEDALGPEHPNVAISLNNLAVLYDNQGRYAEAEPLYQRSLAIREKSLGPEHPDVAISLNNLAILYNNHGRYAEAEPLYQRAVVVYEKALGPDHRDVATALRNYAAFLRKTGRETEALPLETRANAIREKMKKQVEP